MIYNGNLHDKRIASSEPLMSLDELKKEFPITDKAAQTVIRGREAVGSILTGEDPKMVAVVGPCSVHDIDAAIEYSEKLKSLSDEVSEKIQIVERLYFEKPRTTIGWFGLITDPYLNGVYDTQEGLNRARKLLLDVNEMGLPVATEVLDPALAQYLSGLVSLAAIGARTSQSQIHRKLASGLSMPVGVKNETDGNISKAVEAIVCIREHHQFIGPDNYGITSIVNTLGNPYSFPILRGGKLSGPGYTDVQVDTAQGLLHSYGLSEKVMIDCSHDNSARMVGDKWVKDYRLQAKVLESVVHQHNTNLGVFGFMIESNLYEGNQKLDPAHPENLKYGVSITDACVSFDQTREMILRAADKIAV